MARARLAMPLAVFALAVFALAVLAFSALHGPSADGGRRAGRAVAPAAIPAGATTGRRVALLQAQIRAGARPAPYAALGSAYLLEVRETGDAGYYRRADEALTRARRADPADVEALIASGTLALARHDFRGALRLGERARREQPEAVGALPVVVDALVELGRYADAGRTLQLLVDRKPGLPAYARVSYFRELHGDLAGAAAAMRLAASAGSATPEGSAYVQTLLGTLELTRGRTAAAQVAFDAALAAQPGYPAAQAGQARADAAQGRLGRAIRTLRGVVARRPLPEYVVALGEAELVAGRKAQGRQDLALVPVERRLLGVNGVNTDVEFALFEADHGNPRRAVDIARRAWRAAPSVRSADAMGWALTRDGRARDGLAWANRALRLGSRDASFAYHAGVAAAAAGRPATARRLLRRAVGTSAGLTPYHARLARRALAEVVAHAR